jgi:hypothetical protein
MNKTKHEPPLQCSLPPEEALRRAMMVEAPLVWDKAVKPSKRAKKKAAKPKTA